MPALRFLRTLRPEARSRVNTVFMVCYFIGGATGSAVGVTAWRAFGWVGVCVAGIAFTALAGWIHHATRPRVDAGAQASS